jgi:DNA invertase Pin-like site-specific DNA recombinase
LRIKTALHAEELIKISTRTKAAWDAKKARGYVHKVPNNLTPEANAKSLAVRKANAKNNENSRRAVGYIKMLRDHNKLSYRAIVKRLEQEGFRTPRGKSFDPTTVKRLYTLSIS